MSEKSHQRYWLGLHLIPQVGSARVSRLLSHFPSAEALWSESDEAVLKLELPPSILKQFVKNRRAIDLEREMDKVRRLGAKLITLDDDNFPQPLRNIPDRPTLLYMQGSLTPADDRAIALVGTRKPTKYGVDCARELSQEIAANGVAIVSGLAHGIDAAAHRGAIQGGGRTIAVMATGIDAVYPTENRELAVEIRESGALLTEMPIGASPLGKNFPRRNRIISGLALAVLVAEAPEKSGAMNTVTHAMDQGRDVFAVPHNISRQSGAGCNRLIQEGAKLVMEARDVLEELDLSYVATQTKIATQQAHPSDEKEALILEQLGDDPLHIDDIVRGTNLPTAAVMSALVLMELKGLVAAAGPMQYCRA